jgi:hypothetical protein
MPCFIFIVKPFLSTSAGRYGSIFAFRDWQELAVFCRSPQAESGQEQSLVAAQKDQTALLLFAIRQGNQKPGK